MEDSTSSFNFFEHLIVNAAQPSSSQEDTNRHVLPPPRSSSYYASPVKSAKPNVKRWNSDGQNRLKSPVPPSPGTLSTAELTNSLTSMSLTLGSKSPGGSTKSPGISPMKCRKIITNLKQINEVPAIVDFQPTSWMDSGFNDSFAFSEGGNWWELQEDKKHDRVRGENPHTIGGTGTHHHNRYTSDNKAVASPPSTDFTRSREEIDGAYRQYDSPKQGIKKKLTSTTTTSMNSPKPELQRKKSTTSKKKKRVSVKIGSNIPSNLQSSLAMLHESIQTMDMSQLELAIQQFRLSYRQHHQQQNDSKTPQGPVESLIAMHRPEDCSNSGGGTPTRVVEALYPLTPTGDDPSRNHDSTTSSSSRSGCTRRSKRRSVSPVKKKKSISSSNDELEGQREPRRQSASSRSRSQSRRRSETVQEIMEQRDYHETDGKQRSRSRGRRKSSSSPSDKDDDDIAPDETETDQATNHTPCTEVTSTPDGDVTKPTRTLSRNPPVRRRSESITRLPSGRVARLRRRSSVRSGRTKEPMSLLEQSSKVEPFVEFANFDEAFLDKDPDQVEELLSKFFDDRLTTAPSEDWVKEMNCSLAQFARTAFPPCRNEVERDFDDDYDDLEEDAEDDWNYSDE